MLAPAPALLPLAQQIALARARLLDNAGKPHAGTTEILTHADQDHATSAPAASSGTIHAQSVAPTSSSTTSPSPTSTAYPAPVISTEQPGLDVASYQGAVDWPTVASNGAKFAYVKSTEGTYYKNSFFTQQYGGSQSAGLIRGAYHFAIPSNSGGSAQADYFVANGGAWVADGQTLPGMLDIEYNPYGPTCYGLTQAQMVIWITTFDSEYHYLTDRFPEIYTTTDWWKTCTGNSPYFADEGLSIANYSNDPYPVPASWSDYTFWQFADQGVYPGDQETFNGTYQALTAFATTTGPGAQITISLAANATACDQKLPVGTVVGMADAVNGDGYWIADNVGQVATCGNATRIGQLPIPPSSPVVAITSTASGKGFFLVSADGTVYPFGDAVYHGDMAGRILTKPIVAMAADPATGGYWLLGGDGGVFSFGAPFYGSTGSIRLNKPAVGMISNPTGSGYYFVASDGGVFTYDAIFFGSMGGKPLNKPIVGIAIDPQTGGYWMDASDGGIFSFNAPFEGSTGSQHLNQPCVSMASYPPGPGYRFVAADGGIFDFNAPFAGSAA